MADSRRHCRVVWFSLLLIVFTLSLLPMAGSYDRSQDALTKRFLEACGITVQELEAHGFYGLARLLRGEPENAAPASSLPRWNLPSGYQASNSTVRMIFAQVADGAIPGTNRSYQTTFLLVNDSHYSVDGILKFYDDNGAPLKLTVGAVTDSNFPIYVYKGEILRLVTSGTGKLQTGWASIETNQPLTGTSSFAIRDVYGKYYTDVGVAESLLGTGFTIFAYSKGSTYTGLALVNPSDTNPVVLSLELIDDKGLRIAETSQRLGPRGHTARFLNEFFPTVANISNFEGSLAVNSTDGQRFAGITLRLNGDQFTSLPMVAPPAAGSTTDRLIFPQVADGLLGKLKYATSLILMNNSTDRATGRIALFKSDGTPMVVTIAGKTAALFDFDLPARAVTRLVTSGSGDAKVGWCRVSMDRPISGVAIFHVFDSQGQALAEVGVNSADLMTRFNLIADSIGFFDTGIAVANPSESTQTAYVNFNLYDKFGIWLARRKEIMTLAPSKHQALFITQLFPDYAGISEFEGLIQVSSDLPLAAMTLRSLDEKLTSVPILTEVHGFAPDTGIEFAQNLAGTASAMRWQLRLNSYDLATASMKVTCPGLKFQSSGIKKGDEIGFGTLLLGDNRSDSGFLKLLVTNTNPLEFRAVADFPLLRSYNLSAYELFTARVSNSTSGALIFEISSVSLGRSQWNGGTRVDLDFSFHPDLILLPATAGSATVAIDYVSSSGIAGYLVPKVLRSSTQPLTFAAPDPAKPNITALWPLFATAGDILTLQGSNFGTNPKIIFPLAKNASLTAFPLQADSGSLSVLVPEGIISGAIRVDNGSGPGNGYIFRVLYAPSAELILSSNAPGSDAPFTLKFNQSPLELPTIALNLNILNVDRTLSGLAKGAIVGSFRLVKDYGSSFSNDVDLELRVSSSETDKLVLYLAYKNDPTDYRKGTITVTRIPLPGSGLAFSYVPGTFPEAPYLLLYPTQLEIAFSGLPIKLPISTDSRACLAARLQSGPSDLGGMPTAVTVHIAK